MKKTSVVFMILLLIFNLMLLKGAFAQTYLDLFVKDIKVSKTIIFEDDSFDILVKLGVKGEWEEIKESPEVIVSLFWDIPSRFTLIDSKIITVDGKNVTIKFSVNLEKKDFISESMDLTGDRYLVAEVDSGHDLPEINEKNNVFKEKIHIFSKKSTVIDLWIGKKTAIINNKEYKLDVPPIIKDGRTLVPIRFIAEGFGGEVGWDGEEKKITIEIGKTTIVMWIGKKTALINDKEYKLDVPPIIKDGRTLVPIRFIAEGFGSYVFWFSKDKKITIVYEG